MTVVVLVALAGLALPVWDAVRPRGFLRLATRNLWRRRGEAGLVVLGSLLGTAIITASFLVGDTYQSSVRASARTSLGPIDERVEVADGSRLAAVTQQLSTPRVTGTDGVLAWRSVDVAAAAPGSDRSEPARRLVELDVPAARAFGGDIAATGLAAVTRPISGRDAVLNEDLAHRLRVEPGDHLRTYAYGRHLDLTVRQVVPALGLAGDASVLVAPGTIDRLAGTTTPAGAEPPRAEVLVSNDGGVYDGTKSTATVERAIDARLDGARGISVETAKKDLLDEADAEGRFADQLFMGVGSFSVLAGVLLLVNLFVMLAEERKADLGMLRAIGFKRSHLMRAFALEGSIYAVVASVVGALVGVGLGKAVVAVTGGFLGGDGITIRFAAPGSSLALGGAIGLVIALVTVWSTSGRIARLNPIAAIRDLPDPEHRSRGRRLTALGGTGLAVGAAMALIGVFVGVPLLTVVGPMIACFAGMPVAGHHLPRRVAVPLLAAGALAWGALVFSFLPGRPTDGAGIPVFVAQGVLMVGAAVTLLSQADRLWAWLADLFGRRGRGVAARLGLAYPLARTFRTGLLLGMYALVMFTLTFMAVFVQSFQSQQSSIVRSVSAGRDIVLDANPANPPDAAQVGAVPGVAEAVPLLRAQPEFRQAGASGKTSEEPMTGVDAQYVATGTPTLKARLARYGTDRAAFDAVLRDPSLGVVSDSFLRERSTGPGGRQLQVGDVVVGKDAASGRTHRFTIIGVTDFDSAHDGLYASRAAVSDLMGNRAVANRVVVSVDPGASADKVADRLEERLLGNGVQARSFTALVDQQQAAQVGFFRLIQGYLGIGLLVGIAGLGVVMVRAVRERRREIGMLRAMGFGAGVVHRAFIGEAAFITIQGLAVGVGIGVLTAYQILANSTAFGGNKMPFSLPGVSLLVIAAVPLGASLLAALIPAGRAAAIKPARALRAAG